METSVQLVPQTYKVSEFSNTVTSQSFETESYEVAPWDVPDPKMHADATPPDKMEVKEWSFDVDARRGGHAFGSNGDLFAHGSYKVARIDVSENTQTIWTLPTDWSTSSIHHTTVSPSGLYYFKVNGNITSLDPNTGKFTQWDVELGNEYIHSSSDGIYFQPRSWPLYIADNRDPQIKGIYFNSAYGRSNVYGDGASGLIDMKLVSPSDKTYTAYNWAESDGRFFGIFYDVYLNKSDHYDYNFEAGNYTVSISDMFKTIETTFEIGSDGSSSDDRGSSDDRVIPTTTKHIFLQRLNPDTNSITSFVVDVPDEFHYTLIHHDLSDSLYFVFSTNDGTGLAKFIPNLGELVYWIDTSNDKNIFDTMYYWGRSNIAVSDEKIYWIHSAERHTSKIVIFDTNTGEINEVIIPHRCGHDQNGSITVDSSGHVFFQGYGCGGIHKFIPSTNEFIKFTNSHGIGKDFLRADSSDVIYWVNWGSMGTVSFVQPTPIVISSVETTSSTEIRITTDHELFGLSNTSEFSVPGNTILDVALSGTMILVTLDTTIIHDDVVTISYSGSSIYGEDTIFETFVDMAVTNNVVEDESESPELDTMCVRVVGDVCVTESEIGEEESESSELPESADTPADEEA